MSDEKTEQPSSKRLRDAREKGQVAKSQDVPSALNVMVIAVYFAAMSDTLFNQMVTMTELPMHFIDKPFDEALSACLGGVSTLALLMLMPILAVAMGVALISNLAQVGVLFSFQAAAPKLDNISPSKWFGKVFAMKNLVEFLKNVIKVLVLGYAVWVVVEDHMQNLFAIPNGNIGGMWTILGTAVSDLVFMAAEVFCGIAAIDYVYQKWQFNKQNMMSKEEVKREYKESEGDPHVKGKRKQLAKEMANENTVGNVRKAKVLVTNPTHFAVALDYEKDKTPLPIIVAKGEGALAQRMIKVAEEEGIPIMRNVPLARSLFEQGTENAYIPKDLLAPVAEVLRWVMSLK